MMRNFPLENGIYCKGNFTNFKLYYNNVALTPSCNLLTYIPKVLIAVKINKAIFVYKPELVTVDNTYVLVKVATFEAFDTCACLKLKINNKIYIIDSNVQVKLCESTKMY